MFLTTRRIDGVMASGRANFEQRRGLNRQHNLKCAETVAKNQRHFGALTRGVASVLVLFHNSNTTLLAYGGQAHSVTFNAAKIPPTVSTSPEYTCQVQQRAFGGVG